MNSRPSIRDVAQKAGVSHTTASLALRNDPRISAPTHHKVVQAALKLDYRRHAVVSDLMAQLRTLKVKTDTATLGFITAWPTRDSWRQSPNQRRFFEGVQARASELGYKVEEFWLREPGMTSKRMSRILHARGIRGLILQSLPKAHGHLSLEWEHFAAVAKGLTIDRPRLHRVISSHFEDMRLVGHHLKRLGYRRLGLVLETKLDERVDHAWLAAYLLHQHNLLPCDRVPALIVETDQQAEKFGLWVAQHSPDVILYSGLPLLDWIKDLGLRVPEDIGVVHLDWSEEVKPLAGIDADSEMQGEAAVDMLVGQLHANEYGVPAREKIVAVSGRWVMGKSLRRA